MTKDRVVETYQRCRGTTKAQKPCRAKGLLPGGYCFSHSPSVTAEERSAAGRRGALASNRKYLVKKLTEMTAESPTLVAQPPKLDTTESCLTYVQEVASKVESGELAPSIGNTLAGLVSLAVRIREVALDEMLAGRLDELERTLPKGPRIVEVGA